MKYMLIQFTGGALLTKGAAVISKPEEYEFHWTSEFLDGTEIKMFDGTSQAEGKRSFELVVEPRKEALVCFHWRGIIRNTDVHFGVSLQNPSRFPAFMFNGQVLQPQMPELYRGEEFIPKCFVRHVVDFAIGSGHVPKHTLGQMSYYVGFVSKGGHEFYISYNGNAFRGEGFSQLVKIGDYKL